MFRKCQLGHVGCIMKVLRILADFLPACSIDYQERIVEVYEYCHGFAYFSLEFC